jgi:hypothetical protein
LVNRNPAAQSFGTVLHVARSHDREHDTMIWGRQRAGDAGMKEKSFEGATEAEVQKLAEDWIKTQPGIRITNTRITTIASGPTRPGEPIRSPDGWTIIVEYEGGSN